MSKLEQSKIISKFIDNGLWYFVIKHLDLFENVDQKWLIRTMIKSHGWRYGVTKWLDKFDIWNRKRIIDYLIEKWLCLQWITENLLHREDLWIDKGKLLHALIQNINRNCVIEYIDTFSGISHQFILNKMFVMRWDVNREYYSEKILSNIHIFQWIDYDDLVLKIVKKVDLDLVMKYFELLKPRIHEDKLVNFVCKNQKILYFAPRYIDMFTIENQKKLIRKLLQYGYFSELKKNKKKLHSIDKKRFTTEVHTKNKLMNELLVFIAEDPSKYEDLFY